MRINLGQGQRTTSCAWVSVLAIPYPLTEAAARRAAELQQGLKQKPIGERDVPIAGVCLAVGLPLLTANVRHFKLVPGLDVVQAR